MFFPEKSARSDRDLPLEVFYYIKVRLYRRENNRFETISDLAIKVISYIKEVNYFVINKIEIIPEVNLMFDFIF